MSQPAARFSYSSIVRPFSGYQRSKLEDFAALANKAGLEVLRVWLDPERMFSVQYLVRAGSVAR